MLAVAPGPSPSAQRAPLTLALHQVDKAYGARPVLRGVSLTVAEGQFVSLLGPSGCGKTTLLNAIAGLIDVDGGRIALGGETWSARH